MLRLIGVRRFGLTVFLNRIVLLRSLAVQGTDAMVAFITLSYLKSYAELHWTLIVMSISIFVTFGPDSLGGLGLREGTLAGVLAVFGVPASTAIIFSFMIYLTRLLVGLFG